MIERPVASHLFRTSPTLTLLAGRHRESGRIVFPAPVDADTYEAVALPNRGTLWSFTIQRFEPKSPPYHADGPFRPFAVGYVELPEALIIESRLVGAEHGAWHIGQAVELTTFTLRTEGDERVLMYAFRPTQAAAS